MSLAALTRAVRDQLKAAAPDGLALLLTQCEVMADDRPPPRCPNTFYAVHGQATEAGIYSMAVWENYNINVTISVRLMASFDRIATDEMLATGAAFYERSDDVRACLMAQWVSVLNRANAYVGVNDLSATTHRRFIEPLVYTGTDGNPRLVGGSWFWGDPKHENCGLRQTIRFHGAKCIQDLPTLT